MVSRSIGITPLFLIDALSDGLGMKMKVMEICRLLRSLEIQGKRHRQNGMDRTSWCQNSNALHSFVY